MKAEGLLYSKYWDFLGYKDFETEVTTQTCKEINSNLTDKDITRLAKGCQMDETKFRQLIEGAAAPKTVTAESDKSEAVDSKENDSGIVEENPKVADNNTSDQNVSGQMASAASEETKQVEQIEQTQDSQNHDATNTTDIIDAPVDVAQNPVEEEAGDTTKETTITEDKAKDVVETTVDVVDGAGGGDE